MDEKRELPEDAPHVGDLFAERYRIEGVLGIGGMGYVLAATHLHLQQKVAIKLLFPELVRNATTVERFLREGRAAVKIRSEHVARVLDVAELPNKAPYLVMEFLDGSDLSALLEERKKVPAETAVDWVLEACQAVSEAHSLGIVHRDLKPANLFLTRLPSGNEVVKVLDFGISKLTDGQNLSMTKSSSMLGSPLYMSPEQLRNARQVDERADQWGLGVILYELIVGVPPYNVDTLAELGSLVLSNDSAPQLIDAAPDVSPELSDIVNTMLQKKAEARFVNLADLALALAPFGGPGAAASCAKIVQTMGEPVPRRHKPRRPPQQRKKSAAIAASVVLALVGGAVIYQTQKETPAAATTTVATATVTAPTPPPPSVVVSAPVNVPAPASREPEPAPPPSVAPKPPVLSKRPPPAKPTAPAPAPSKPPSGIATSSKD